MNYRLQLVRILLPALLLSTPLRAQDASQYARIDSVITSLVTEQAVAGVKALLWQQGEVIYSHSEGFQDLAAKVPITDSTLFRIYSMTKPVTSVAALMLVEDGVLALQDPVANFIPAFGGTELYDRDAPDRRVPSPREITIFHLLTHTAGLTYGLFSNTAVDSLYWAHQVWSPGTLDEFADRIAGIPLLYAPGTDWHYSVATDILGRVIEVVSGQPLSQFFSERILEPLKMHDTAFSVPKERIGRLSMLYSPCSDGALAAVDGGPDSDFAAPVERMSGGGGLVSTPEDYLSFARMLLNGGSLDGVTLLQPTTVALMTQDHLESGPDAAWGFGLGFEVILDPEGLGDPGVAGTYGWSGAANTFFFIDPQSELIGLFFVQRRPFDKNRFLHPFKEAVYESLR